MASPCASEISGIVIGVELNASAIEPPGGRMYIRPDVLPVERAMISLPSAEMSAAVSQLESVRKVVISSSVVVPLVD